LEKGSTKWLMQATDLSKQERKCQSEMEGKSDRENLGLILLSLCLQSLTATVI
jgi:hypothetical protein